MNDRKLQCVVQEEIHVISVIKKYFLGTPLYLLALCKAEPHQQAKSYSGASDTEKCITNTFSVFGILRQDFAV